MVFDIIRTVTDKMKKIDRIGKRYDEM